MTKLKGTILVDFDRTLAVYRGTDHNTIGPPVKMMTERVKRWLNDGYTVRIFTARAASTSPNREQDIRLIGDWAQEHIGRRLEVTAEKGFDAVLIVDDLASGVVANTGILVNMAPTGPGNPLTNDEEAELIDNEQAIETYVEDTVARGRRALEESFLYALTTPSERAEALRDMEERARAKITRVMNNVSDAEDYDLRHLVNTMGAGPERN